MASGSLGQFTSGQQQRVFYLSRVNSRFIGSVQCAGSRLASAVEEAKREVERQVKLVGYTFDWGGEYKDYGG
jgi:Cu/Ag efflux pump CusA